MKDEAKIRENSRTMDGSPSVVRRLGDATKIALKGIIVA
jgi:hypothetical protein